MSDAFGNDPHTAGPVPVPTVEVTTKKLNELVENQTPNVVIENPEDRKRWNTIISITLLVVAIVQLFFVFFPEVAFGSTIPDRAINFLLAVIALVSAWFGLGVTRQNYPTFR
jgi:hypothetical protein